MFYIGDPEHHIDDFQFQELDDNCAVAAQASIIGNFIPGDLGVDEATYVAEANGWYVPGFGTAQEDMGNLFGAYGVPYHSVQDASVTDLLNELQQGHGIVASINSGDLWDQGPSGQFWDWLMDALGLDCSSFIPANHAVSVIGVDCSDPSHPMVILNDSGHPDGAGIMYPLDQFVDAWENSECSYVATDIAMPEAGPLGFDISELPGMATRSVGGALGLDLPTAATAGQVVSELCEAVDWNVVLASI